MKTSGGATGRNDIGISVVCFCGLSSAFVLTRHQVRILLLPPAKTYYKQESRPPRPLAQLLWYSGHDGAQGLRWRRMISLVKAVTQGTVPRLKFRTGGSTPPRSAEVLDQDHPASQGPLDLRSSEGTAGTTDWIGCYEERQRCK